MRMESISHTHKQNQARTMSSLKVLFLPLTVIFLLILSVCVFLMFTGEDHFRCEPKKNEIHKNLGFNLSETVECYDAIKRYTFDVPLLLVLFGIYHMANYIIRLFLNDVDDLLAKSVWRQILGLIKRTIILSFYAGICAYVYFEVLKFGRQEGSYLQAIPSDVSCNRVTSSTNSTVEIKCHLDTPTRLNNTLLFLLIESCFMFLTFFYEVGYLLFHLVFVPPAQYLYNIIRRYVPEKNSKRYLPV